MGSLPSHAFNDRTRIEERPNLGHLPVDYPEGVAHGNHSEVRLHVEYGRYELTFGDVPVDFIGRSSFIRNKRATGRARDLGDIEGME